MTAPAIASLLIAILASLPIADVVSLPIVGPVSAKSVIVLCGVVAAVMCVLIISLLSTTSRHVAQKHIDREIMQTRLHFDNELIGKCNDKIDKLNAEIAVKNVQIASIADRSRRLSEALYRQCLAWPKINALLTKQYAPDERESKANELRLTNAERASLLYCLRACRDENNPGEVALTDDELILLHLLSCGLDKLEIALLMGVANGTLRQRKFRLVNKLKEAGITLKGGQCCLTDLNLCIGHSGAPDKPRGGARVLG